MEGTLSMSILGNFTNPFVVNQRGVVKAGIVVTA